MRIEQVTLRVVRLPLVRTFRTSSSTKDHIDHILVRDPDGRGGEGWGESASPTDPYYCPETTETCWHILKDFLVPRVLGRDWATPDDLAACSGRSRGTGSPAPGWRWRRGMPWRGRGGAAGPTSWAGPGRRSPRG